MKNKLENIINFECPIGIVCGEKGCESHTFDCYKMQMYITVMQKQDNLQLQYKRIANESSKAISELPESIKYDIENRNRGYLTFN